MNRETVVHLAALSRLALTDEEIDTMTTQLEQIESAVVGVQSAPTDGVPTTTHAVQAVNVFRDDEPRQSLTADEALSGAPAVEMQRFKVPA